MLQKQSSVVPAYAGYLIAGVGLLLVGGALAADVLGWSAPGLTVDRLALLLVGMIGLLAGFGLRFTYTHAEPTRLLPETLWSALKLALVIAGVILFTSSAVDLRAKPNTVSQFIGINDRTPIIYSMTHPREVLLLIAGLAILFLALRLGERARLWISAAVQGMFRQWHMLPRPVYIALTTVILIGLAAFNRTQVMAHPFQLTRNWDPEAAIWRGSKEYLLEATISGLNNGCLLCTSDHQPIENITQGDDIGLFWIFGLLTRAGLENSLYGYRTYIAYSVALIILLASIIVSIGYRALLPGIIFAIFITLFDTITRYEAMLILSYWVPAGAAVLSGALALALLARAGRDRAAGIRPNFWLYGAGFVLWGLTAGWSYLGRSSAGPATLFAALLVLIIIALHLRSYFVRWLPALGLLVGGTALPILAFNFTLDYRMAHENVSQLIPNTASTHGFSHGVLVGLGYVINDEGIVWDDNVGVRIAKQACPEVLYLSPAYYTCIRDEVIHIILNDPDLLIRNLLAKTESTIQTTLSYLIFVIWLPVLAVLVRRSIYFLVFGLLALVNAVPGLLTVPYFAYMQGYFEMLVILGAVTLIEFLQQVGEVYRPPPAERPAEVAGS